MKFLGIEKEFKNILNLRYQSPRTIKSYLNCFYKFKSYRKYWENLSRQDLIDFIKEFRRNYSISYSNQMVSVLYIIYKEVLKQPNKLKSITLLKQPDTLHKVLSVKDVCAAINKLTNLKHKAILSTLFLTGARVSELLNLKLSDIDSNNLTVFIRGGKGRKDRYVPITFELVNLLRKYYLSCRPVEYLFEGIKGKQYSGSSIRAICKRVGIRNPHLLRHSIITHLIDSGDQQLKVQLFAGHKSSKSTLKYYHIAPNSINKLTLPKLT